MKQSVFEVVGGSAVGDKAGLMMEHESLVREVGLDIPPTTVLSSEMVQPALEQLATDLEAGSEAIAGLGEMSVTATKRFSDAEFLVVRSSAEGDGRGTGIYESMFATAGESAVSNAIISVLRSFHGPHAADFRRQIGAGNDFAIMVQPLVGQWLEDDRTWSLFGPPLSGYGYSKTRFDEQGVINVIGGLGGGVDRDGGEQISPASLEIASKYHIEEFDGPMSMLKYIKGIRQAEMYGEIERAQTDFRDQRPLVTHDELRSLAALVLADTGDPWQLESVGLSFENYRESDDDLGFAAFDSAMGAAVKTFEPHKLLEALRHMQDIAGYPLYIEWATQLDEQGLRPYVVQISPVDASPRARLESALPQEIFVVGNNLRGHGEKTADKLVVCGNPQDVDLLRKFNREPGNEGYILIYSGHITSKARHGYLNFGDFSNASVIIETGTAVHANGTALDHISGAMDLTGKLFANASHELSKYFDALYAALEKDGFMIHDEGSWQGRLQVLEGEFKVVADETQDRIFIGR